MVGMGREGEFEQVCGVLSWADYQFYCYRMLGESSSTSFLRRFYGENLHNLARLRQKRERMAANQHTSASTLRTFHRPSSELQRPSSRPQRYSAERPTSEKKMLKQLSTQLTQIQKCIATLKKKSSPKKLVRTTMKMVTEPTEDPKTTIYKQAMRQIEEVKKRRQGLPQTRHQPTHAPSNEESTMFYGVDFIDGVQFKIKVKMDQQRYCLMGKNAHAKVLVEMSTQEYMQLHRGLFKNNPCGIFNYLTINNNRLELRIGNRKPPKSLQTYLNYY